VGYFRFANRALGILIWGERGTLDVKPLVDARPAVEMAAEGDDRVIYKV